MKLSAEQAQRAYDYMQQKGPLAVNTMPSRTNVSSDLIQRALSRIAHTPDPRPDRVAHALDALDGRLPSPAEVAERIVWRTLADSVR